MTDLSAPHLVQGRLESIEEELAVKQNAYEDAARRWYRAKRDVAVEQARGLLTAAEKSVTEKKARGILAAESVEDADSEAEYEALRVRVDVLQTRASICQSILKAQGRA